MALHAVIMAGGVGTRFWPQSREHRPKQLLPLLSERTLLRETVDRLAGFIPRERTWCVVSGTLAEPTARELPDVPRAQIIAEPVGRNTAPCVGLAATYAARQDPEAILAILPADHFIGETERLTRALQVGAEVAARGDLVTVGIEPTRPETGYGYIRVAEGEPEEIRGERVSRVEAFVEKPDAPTAEAFLRSGRYLWNGGIFVFSASAILRAMDEFLPDLARDLQAFAKAIGTPSEGESLRTLYEGTKAISIDYGVMEHAKNIRVVRADFGWNDVGSWQALGDVLPHDGALNVVVGKFVGIESRGLIVHSPRHLVATVGCDDLIIVATDDVVMVAPRERAQEVRRLVEELRRRNLREYL